MSRSARKVRLPTAFLLSYGNWQGWLSVHDLQRTVPLDERKPITLGLAQNRLSVDLSISLHQVPKTS